MLQIWREAVRRPLAAIGIALLSATAFAVAFAGQDIKIVKAVGSPAVTVQYTGLHAVKVEIRVNGVSIGYRTMDPKQSQGEAAFALSLDSLQQGDNLIEALLLDADGKVIGTEKTVLTVQKGENLPVYITLPRMGETVQGTVQINVDFGVQTRDRYVSFFVDKEFRSMRNFPPFTYYWDTRRELNGWHEIQVWTFDETQTTNKSPLVRVFVQNPGGRTERPAPPKTGEGAVSPPPVKAGTGTGSPLKGPGGEPGVAGGNMSPPSGTPGVTGPGVQAPLGKSAGQKMAAGVRAEVAGHRLSQPTAAATVPPVAAQPEPSVPEAGPGGLLKIGFGTRVSAEGPYKIYLDEVEVRFDVQPRVTNGVPLTPFRHLYEHAGGTVDWQHFQKVCTATGLGYDVWLKIGDLFARVNGKPVQLEMPAFIESGRTVVPLSFIESTLSVGVEYDPQTGHVLITKAESKD
ncbi:MAG: hypothetical protein IH851_11740 [Armatimonadetes bacterium]|nr:hypothetical protein [Armatimonadota bacterium]